MRGMMEDGESEGYHCTKRTALLGGNDSQKDPFGLLRARVKESKIKDGAKDLVGKYLPFPKEERIIRMG